MKNARLIFAVFYNKQYRENGERRTLSSISRLPAGIPLCCSPADACPAPLAASSQPQTNPHTIRNQEIIHEMYYSLKLLLQAQYCPSTLQKRKNVRLYHYFMRHFVMLSIAVSVFIIFVWYFYCVFSIHRFNILCFLINYSFKWLIEKELRIHDSRIHLNAFLSRSWILSVLKELWPAATYNISRS